MISLPQLGKLTFKKKKAAFEILTMKRGFQTPTIIISKRQYTYTGSWSFSV